MELVLHTKCSSDTEYLIELQIKTTTLVLGAYNQFHTNRHAGYENLAMQYNGDSFSCKIKNFIIIISSGLFQENLPGRHGTEPNFFIVVVGVQTVSVSLVVGVVDISISWVVGLIPRWIYFWWVS